eukprot:6089627-Prymnesium_polylepis.1
MTGVALGAMRPGVFLPSTPTGVASDAMPPPPQPLPGRAARRDTRSADGAMVSSSFADAESEGGGAMRPGRSACEPDRLADQSVAGAEGLSMILCPGSPPFFTYGQPHSAYGRTLVFGRALVLCGCPIRDFLCVPARYDGECRGR